jgi:hypothetical protein
VHDSLVHEALDLVKTSWDAETWPIAKTELLKAVRMRAVLARAPWWN